MKTEFALKTKFSFIAFLFIVGNISSSHARYYDASAGRFISPDSFVPDPMDPQLLNRYSYVRNNPLIYIDPTGNSLEKLLRGVTAIFPMFAPSLTFNAWDNNVNNSQDFQHYASQAVAWNAAIGGVAWGAVNAPNLAASGITESALGTGDGRRFQERMGDEVFHDALGMSNRDSMFMSGLTLRLAGSAAMTTGFNAYNNAFIERSMLLAESSNESVIDLGTLYWSRPAPITTNQLAGISLESVLGASNFAAGWGDNVSMGATSHVRSWLNIQSVDTQSIAYGAGELTGMANQAGLAMAGGISGIQRGGFLNNNPYARLGYGWNAEKQAEVFRLAIGSKRALIHWHLDFPWWMR